jgi:hypothetical protein
MAARNIKRGDGMYADFRLPESFETDREWQAYRLGMLDTLLHRDSVEALQPAAIVKEAFESERAFRLRELERGQ